MRRDEKGRREERRGEEKRDEERREKMRRGDSDYTQRKRQPFMFSNIAIHLHSSPSLSSHFTTSFFFLFPPSLPHTPPPSSSFPLLLLPSFFLPSRSLLVLVPGGRPLLPLLPSLPPREKNRFTHVSTNGEFHPLALPRPVLLHAAVAAGKWVNLLYNILVYCLYHALFILHPRLSCR